MLNSRSLLPALCGLLVILAACSGSSNKNNTKPAARQLTPAASFAAATSALGTLTPSSPSPSATGLAGAVESATASEGSAGSATSAPSNSSGTATAAPAAAGTSATSQAAAGTQAAATPQFAPVASTPTTSSATGAQSRVYTVVAGDTLGKIATRLGVSTGSLVDANPGIDPDLLHIGQKLTLPAGGAAANAGPAVGSATAVRSSLPTRAPTRTATRVPSATAAAAAGTQTYTVQSGDTACTIARAKGVSLQSLATANSTTPSALDTLHIGQKLTIPASSGAASGC